MAHVPSHGHREPFRRNQTVEPLCHAIGMSQICGLASEVRQRAIR